MLKRLLSLALSFAFVTTASASSITPMAVVSAMEEFNFAVNVEWDQKDPEFYKAQVSKLENSINTLVAEGMTLAEVIDVAASTIKNEQLAREMKKALSLVELNKLSLEESQKLLITAAQNSASSGASWTGDALFYLGPILAIGIVVAIISSGGNSNGASTGGGYNCGYNYSCYWGYDFWGYYSYQCDYIYICY